MGSELTIDTFQAAFETRRCNPLKSNQPVITSACEARSLRQAALSQFSRHKGKVGFKSRRLEVRVPHRQDACVPWGAFVI